MVTRVIASCMRVVLHSLVVHAIGFLFILYLYITSFEKYLCKCISWSVLDITCFSSSPCVTKKKNLNFIVFSVTDFYLKSLWYLNVSRIPSCSKCRVTCRRIQWQDQFKDNQWLNAERWLVYMLSACWTLRKRAFSHNTSSICLSSHRDTSNHSQRKCSSFIRKRMR